MRRYYAYWKALSTWERIQVSVAVGIALLVLLVLLVVAWPTVLFMVFCAWAVNKLLSFAEDADRKGTDR